MIDSPGDDPFISIRDLATLARISPTKVYAAARAAPQLLPLDPDHKGVRSSHAQAWLRLRTERQVRRAEAQLRRFDQLEAKRAAKRAAKEAARQAILERLRKAQEEVVEQLRGKAVDKGGAR